MTKDRSFINNLLELLTERSKVELQQNATMYNLLYDITHFDRNSPNAKENAKKLWDRIQKPINTSASNHAGYTWNGTSTRSTAFLKSPKNVEVVDGNVETYRDPLWFYIDPNTKKMASYLDERGMIKPGHEDVIARVNEKYGLQLDPNAPIIKNGRYDQSQNREQFDIWKNKYFIPWYKEHSTDGASWDKLFKQYVTGELPLDEPKEKEKPEEISQEIPVTVPVPSEPEYDKSVIDSIIKEFNNKPSMAYGRLFQIANGTEPSDATPQQVYNTIKQLYKKVQTRPDIKNTYTELEQNLADLLFDYRKAHKNDIKGKMESVDDKKSSWLTRNGDYFIFDKLNNLFRLQKESKENDMTDSKLKVLHEDNVFSSINTNENDFDPSKVTSDVFNDDSEQGAISEKDELKKSKLTKEVLDKINDTLKLNKEVQDILDEIREINNHNDYNIWVVNEEGNTATLASKNAKIFKQNMNLCLSHDNDIEIFKSVQELHDWLRAHNYPLPKNIQLHESVKLQEADEDQKDVKLDVSKYDGLGKWIDILHLNGWSQEEYDKLKNKDKKEESGLDEDFCCGNMGDTTSASLGTALQYLYKNKKESLEKGAFINKLKELKEDDTDVASNFDSAIQNNAGFGSDDSSSDMSTDTSSDLNSGMNSNQDDTVDLGQDGSNEDPSSSFGDLNIGGYGPDNGNPEEDSMDMTIPQEQYQIVDVLADKEDNIRVKVKNLTSGKIEYKDLSEIDV